MQTNIPESLLNTYEGSQANDILRKCVHCGFCTATCPSYQILGDELDSPRGRIYLIKQMLEGNEVTRKTQSHFDKCLTCRNCETTCPSGVEYGKLIDIGRQLAEKNIKRPPGLRLLNKLLAASFSRPEVFSFIFTIGKRLRFMLPRRLAKKLTPIDSKISWSNHRSKKKIILLTGCVQPSLDASLDKQYSHLLSLCDIETYPIAGCCGSVQHHLNQHAATLKTVTHNLRLWHRMLKNGYEAISMTASGCGLAIRDYPNLFEPGTSWHEMASFVAEKYRDPVELLDIDIIAEHTSTPDKTYVFHPPCTLQHGLKLEGKVTACLHRLNINIKPFSETHLCCGSAGTYSITQPQISSALLARKLDNIDATNPDIILTSNIGCQNHLQSATDTPVRHWINEVYNLVYK